VNECEPLPRTMLIMMRMMRIGAQNEYNTSVTYSTCVRTILLSVSRSEKTPTDSPNMISKWKLNAAWQQGH
jgi:hypothetical protein